ncbi:hypothetical protein PROFUN_01330 [Planoprotostelium fungivorum]|uniref:N-acetyltransferase domain-containing protein n=1 Tax=Planoprotostelium fungivorum TaxID=1890364 RepID=A0A2P6NZV7_9EUKA|nr:hypothetical protein PROFUN_01330 [Planoprotostelium fungivorum]
MSNFDELTSIFFICSFDSEEAVLEYTVEEEKSEKVRSSTALSPLTFGEGLAAVLAKNTFSWAEKNNTKVIPSCSYISKGWLPKNPAFARLVRLR